MARCVLFAALFASVVGFQLPTVQFPQSKVAFSRVSPVVAMTEPSDKAVVVGAAAVGALAGGYLFRELSTAVILAAVLAYSATLSNGVGDAAKAAGIAAFKVYDRTLEVSEQYDMLPKAKSALDSFTTAADSLNENLGITAKIDEQLKISQACERVSDQVSHRKMSPRACLQLLLFQTSQALLLGTGQRAQVQSRRQS